MLKGCQAKEKSQEKARKKPRKSTLGHDHTGLCNNSSHSRSRFGAARCKKRFGAAL
jgi:hypothetical protein